MNNEIQISKSIVTAMRCQETSNYAQTNYLQHSVKCGEDDEESIIVNTDCRHRMVEWCYQIADYCNLHHETVAIAVSCFDRFLITADGANALYDLNMYQLAAMTALYTATKLHEPKAMDPLLVSKLSQGTYIPEQIEDMEMKILVALKFHVNPPTAMAFVTEFLYSMLPSHMIRSETKKDAIYEMSKFQTEIAVQDSQFLAIKQSTIAFAALLNAVEHCDSIGGKSKRTYSQIGIYLSRMTGIDWCSMSFKQVQKALCRASGQAKVVVEVRKTSAASSMSQKAMSKHNYPDRSKSQHSASSFEISGASSSSGKNHEGRSYKSSPCSLFESTV